MNDEMTWSAPQFVGASATAEVAPTSAAPRGLWLAPLVLVVATEYKIRKRDIGEALSGSADFGILLELGLYAIVGLYVYTLLVRGGIRWVPLTILLMGYTTTTAVSALYAPFPMMALARGVQLMIIGLLTVVFASQANRHTVGKMLDAYAVLMTLSIAAGVAWVAPVSRVQQGRFTWLYTHSVISGALLAMSVVLLTARAVGSGRQRVLGELPGFLGHRAHVILLCVHVVFLLRTQTRASAAAAFVACLVVVWLRVAPRFRPQLAGMFLLGVSAFGLLAGGAVLAFVARGEDASRITTLNRRTEIWALAWQSFLRHPFDGRGFTAASGVFYDAVAENGEKPLGGAHNAFVEVVTDVGLIGLVWWLGIISMTIVGIVRLHRRNGPVVDVTALAGLMTCLILNGMTIEGIGTGVSGPALFLFVAAAWVCVSQRAEREALAGSPGRGLGQRRAQSSRQGDVLDVGPFGQLTQ